MRKLKKKEIMLTLENTLDKERERKKNKWEKSKK